MTKKRTDTISISLGCDLAEVLKNKALARKISVSQLVREYVLEELQSKEKEKKLKAWDRNALFWSKCMGDFLQVFAHKIGPGAINELEKIKEVNLKEFKEILNNDIF